MASDLSTTWEPTHGIIRMHEHADAKFGDAFYRSVTIIADEGVATVKAVAGTITHAERKAIVNQLREAGFGTIRWTRHRPDGTVANITHKLR